MVLGAICSLDDQDGVSELFGYIEILSGKLEHSLMPVDVVRCWNRGAAFTLAMEKARTVCREKLKHLGIL